MADRGGNPRTQRRGAVPGRLARKVGIRQNHGRRRDGRAEPVAPKPSAAFLDADAAWVLDNFRRDAFEWTNVPLEWEVNPVNLSLDKTGDSPRLLVSMLAGNQDKSAIVRPLALDLRSRAAISMDVINDTGEPMRMAIALGTGPNDDYYEGRWLALKTGANSGVQFDLQSGGFKCAPNWTHSTRIGHPEATHSLYVVIYNYGKPGRIYLENISALREGLRAPLPPRHEDTKKVEN